ncbi:MAG: ABC transporter ATP-binding protein [Chitinophagaceae bacterium]|nr:ABC transporter ATP-binding protein [Oligoflexus sp.]
MKHALTIDHLALQIGTKTLLDDVSFVIPEAALFLILGPNGAGKTILLRCLAGLLKPTAGHVEIHEKAMAWVPLSQILPFGFRVRELVLMGRYAQHQGFAQDRDRLATDESLRRVGITALADRTYNSLSRGEQTKVDIARALASDAHLILLDEPFSNLDIDSTLQMIVLFRALRAEGRTLVLSHHDLYSVSELATHALFLKKGQVLNTGPIAEVFQAPAIEAAYNVKAIFHEADKFVRFESLGRPD